MDPYEIALKNAIAELRKVAQALNKFADDLKMLIEKRHTEINCTCMEEEEEVGKSFISDVEAVKDLLPDRKIGQWICSVDTCEAICSCCHACSGEPYSFAQRHLKYCNNCGAKMEGVIE